MPIPDRRHRAASKVGIVVLHYNGLDDTLECLESLDPVRSEEVIVWVVDNASADDPSAAIVDRFPWCRLQQNPTNEGWAGGNNAGIRLALEAGCDWVMLLNNDTRVSSRIVERLLVAASGDDRLGVIGPLINEWDPPDQVQTACCFFNPAGRPAMLDSRMAATASDMTAGSTPPVTLPTDIVNGCCMMIRADVIGRVGMIDEAFFLVHEESDFCLRVIESGYRCGVIAESHVWHKHSASFGREVSPVQRYFSSRNSWRLVNKHAAWPGGKSWWTSRRMLLWHSWHLVDHELERGNTGAARAVIDGVADAWLGRFGPRPPRRRPLAWGVHATLRLLSKLRSKLQWRQARER